MTDAITVLTAGEVHGAHVLVLGAGEIGLGLAEWLAERGKRVTVVSEDEALADPPGQPGLLERLLSSGRVALRAGVEAREVVGRGVLIAKAGAIGPLFLEEISAVDAVIAADSRRSSDGLASAARERGLAGEVFEIGDCDRPRGALEAILDGALVGRTI